MSRPRETFVPPIVLDPASSVPLRTQVRAQIAGALRRGAPRGARLPSTRALAALLHVSRNTILAAYEELIADGLIEGRRGVGMTIVSAASPGPLFDLRRVLKDAQFPSRTITVLDPDGTGLYLSY